MPPPHTVVLLEADAQPRSREEVSAAAPQAGGFREKTVASRAQEVSRLVVGSLHAGLRPWAAASGQQNHD